VFRAVIWESGATTPVDLNSRITSNPTGLYLQLAEGINAGGEIVGFAQTLSGDMHGFLATPVNGASADAGFTPSVARPLVLSATARKLLARKLRFGRVGARLRPTE
jgi:probable HAF family extracellular repeat protein